MIQLYARVNIAMNGLEGSPLKKWNAVCYNYKSVSNKTDSTTQEHCSESTQLESTPILTDDADEYEFCMVFPASKCELQSHGKNMVQSLYKLGFELQIYRGKKESEIVVLIRLPLERARDYAEESEIDMLLDEHKAESLLRRGDAERNIAPAVIEHRPDITAYRPCQFIYAPYRSRLEHLYQFDHTIEGPPHPFSELVRLKMCAMLLQSRLPTDADTLHVRKAITQNKLLACFPLHSPAKVRALQTQWSRYPHDSLPLDGIKEYFGEKVCLYFAFADHLSAALVYPAVIGIPLQYYVYLHGNLSGKHCMLEILLQRVIPCEGAQCLQDALINVLFNKAFR